MRRFCIYVPCLMLGLMRSTAAGVELLELQERLARQEQQLADLQAAVAEQQRIIDRLIKERGESDPLIASPSAMPASQPVASRPRVTPLPQPAGEKPRSQQAANGEPVPPLQFRMGTTPIPPPGFVDLMQVLPNRSVASGIGANFVTHPLANTVGGSLGENRLSAQNSRLGLRLDTPYAGWNGATSPPVIVIPAIYTATPGEVAKPSMPPQEQKTVEVAQQKPTPGQQIGPKGEIKQRPELNPTQEVAGETPTGQPLEAGPATIRLGGYIGLTGIFRSTNSGGGIGTSFASIPYDNTLEGNLSEARFSAQSTRLSIRVDAEIPEARPRFRRISGYFEMDFSGNVPGNVAITSSSFGFRLRHAFAEAQYGKFMIGAGQAFSLMTPAKKNISIWPSDQEMTLAVDTNYVAGLVWDRSPQFRFTIRPANGWSFAFSAENPEQQLGSRVKLPKEIQSDIEKEFNTGSNELTIPNLMPDLAFKTAFNSGRFHVDVGGLFRVFRTSIAPYQDKDRQVAGGGNVNFRFGLTPSTQLLAQGFISAGGGRYIGGLAPDAIVRPDGTVSPLRAHSWVTGIEQKVSRDLALAFYYSGFSVGRQFVTDEDGSMIGWGFAGSSNSNNRLFHQVTGIYVWRFMTTESRGSGQWNFQYSYMMRKPWDVGSGPSTASSHMFLTQIRLNLP
jgi:hypothetical protein